MSLGEHAPAELRHTTSIGTRISIGIIVLVSVALVTVGVMLFIVGQQAADRRVHDNFNGQRDEFQILADKGVDPETGQPFQDSARLLETALQRLATGNGEGELGIVGDEIRWTAPDSVDERPEEDPQLVEEILRVATSDYVTYGSIRTDIASYRYMVVPVHFSNESPSGALVRTVNMDVELESHYQTMKYYLIIAAGSLIVIVLIMRVFVGRLLAPIGLLKDATDSIDEDDLTTRVPVHTNDELGSLTVTINGMLDRIESTVDSQRQLLDDVGHELRTPITVVRGHLELMDPESPADVQDTRALVIDELDRMANLVNDLLTLAKAVRPDFLTREITEIGMLTDQTFEKIMALPGHEWRLEQIADATASVDPQRITQAWLQLAANASKYSDEGSIISIGSAVRDDAGGQEIHMWVSDHGIGINPADITRIQQRFERSEEGKSKADGIGLGLSIVISILQAHDGRLEIDSTPGVGSTFTMVVPGGGADEHDTDH